MPQYSAYGGVLGAEGHTVRSCFYWRGTSLDVLIASSLQKGTNVYDWRVNVLVKCRVKPDKNCAAGRGHTRGNEVWYGWADNTAVARMWSKRILTTKVYD